MSDVAEGLKQIFDDVDAELGRECSIKITSAITEIESLQAEVKRLREADVLTPDIKDRLLTLLKSVGHHGVRLDYGEYEIGPTDAQEAQELHAALATSDTEGKG